jgi:sugar/nucleoside kinase (ribokinase family)
MPADPAPRLSSPFDVIVAGDYCLDLVFIGLPRFPELGLEVVGSGFDMVPGGAFNAAVAMHRLGLNVGWAADFGHDDFSRFVYAQAVAEGMSQSLFVHHDRPVRYVTVALSFPHERSFVAYYDPQPDPSAAMLGLAQASTRAIYLAGMYVGPALECALNRAASDHVRLIMDGNSADHSLRTSQPEVQRALSAVDVFLPNAIEACRLTGRTDLREAMLALAGLCPLVVVKDGAAGSLAFHDGQIIRQPAIDVQSVDTTGAGDCYSAGFVKAWLEGRSVIDCQRWGNIVGGLSTLAVGGAGRVITSAEVERWLAEHPSGEGG